MAKYGLNRVTLIGNLGHEPELKYLDQGIAYMTIRLACTDRVRNKEGNFQDRTEWVSVNLWRGQAEIASKYCKRGSTVCIEGRIRTQQWETPEGEKRSRTLVEGQKLILLDGRPVGGGEFSQPVSPVSAATPPQPVQKDVAANSSPQTSSPQSSPVDPATGMDDLPF
ncbi:MAG: single-stranded DNA-binding protein [Bacteroidota bacterium]